MFQRHICEEIAKLASSPETGPGNQGLEPYPVFPSLSFSLSDDLIFNLYLFLNNDDYMFL